MSSNRFSVPMVALVLLAGGLGLRGWLMPEPRASDGDVGVPPTRIVSMSPSITETLFALGVDERIAGVTRYCVYPAAARAKSKVGGFLDPSYERILGLEADLVLLLPYHGDVRERLTGLGVRTLTVDHESVPAILESFETLGRACGEEEAGRTLRARLESELEAVRARVAGRERPRVLVCVGRTLTGSRIDQVYVSGPEGWHAQLAELAGAENVLRETRLAYPTLSAESVIQLNPDAIVEIADPESKDARLAERLRASWQTLDTVAAVRNGRVHIIHRDYAGVPGPRIARLAEDIADALHPETGARP